MCKNWREKGTCRYGDKCLFAHGNSELTKASTSPEKDAEKPEVFITPQKVCKGEADQVGSDSTQATVGSPDCKTRQQSEALDLNLQGEMIINTFKL